MKILQLTFLDSKNSKHILHFSIYTSKLSTRWIEVIEQNQKIDQKKINCKFNNLQISDIDILHNHICECVNYISLNYDRNLQQYVNDYRLTTDILNELHKEFEIYGTRLDELTKSNKWTINLHNLFLKLNELIHQYEDLLFKSGKFPNMHLLFDYYPQEIHLPLYESDKIWLTSHFKWGGVYLGYNTLGKDWLNVYLDNDIEVIIRDAVKVQNRFAAETWINFGPDISDWWMLSEFEKWYNSLSDELKNKVPVHSLNALALGRYKLGQLIITDEFLSRYGGEKKDYEISNSQYKLNWNLSFFSTFVKLIDITFIEYK